MRLYQQGGYANINDLAFKLYELSGDTVKKCLPVAERFVRKTGNLYHSIFRKGDRDFKFSQLIEFKSVWLDSDIQSALDEGKINFDMTTKELRKIAKTL